MDKFENRGVDKWPKKVVEHRNVDDLGRQVFWVWRPPQEQTPRGVSASDFRRILLASTKPETENFNNDGRLGGSKRGAVGEQSPTDVLKQAQEMTAKTRERLSRIGVRDIYGEEANEDSDEANEGANLEEDNLQLLGQGDQRKERSKEAERKGAPNVLS